jgi:hypothetical protein
VEALYRARYQGFTVKPGLHLEWEGLVAKAPRKGGATGADASGVLCQA